LAIEIIFVFCTVCVSTQYNKMSGMDIVLHCS